MKIWKIYNTNDKVILKYATEDKAHNIILDNPLLKLRYRTEEANIFYWLLLKIGGR